jgi:hypothetical protein
MANTNWYLWLLVMLLLAASIGYGSTAVAGTKREPNMTTMQLAADLATIRQARILFSHHSVGANILAGIKRFDAENPGAGRLRVVPVEEAVASKGPALFDYWGGKNGEPKTKIDSFAAIIRSRHG